MVIRSAAVFDANAGVVLIRSLPVANRSHVHRHQFFQACREVAAPSQPDLFKIAEEEAGACARFQVLVVQGLNRAKQSGDGSFVIQVPRFDESVDNFHPRVKRDKVTHFDAKLAHLVGVRNTCVEAYFHAGGIAFLIRHIVVNVYRGFVGQEASANSAILTGVNQAIFSFHATPGKSAHAGQLEPAAGFDLAHHPAEGIHVGGKPVRGWGVGTALSRQESEERAFAGPFSVDFRKSGKFFFHQLDRLA